MHLIREPIELLTYDPFNSFKPVLRMTVKLRSNGMKDKTVNYYYTHAACSWKRRL